MPAFDPRNPPAWVRRLMARAHRRQSRAAEGDAASDDVGDIVSLGHGTFVAPLAAGWSLHPGEPFSGQIRLQEGYGIDYRLESYEDEAAARGEDRLLGYLEQSGARAQVRTPKEALERILVSIPERAGDGAEIVWTRLDSLAGTHLRELVLSCPLTPALLPHRLAIARAVAAWLNLGGFAPEQTALDRVAHTEALERVNFQDNLLMRVPRRWSVTVDGEKDGRKLYAVDEPEDRETVWINSRHLRMPAGSDPEEFLARTVDAVWEGMPAQPRRPLMRRRRDDLPQGDVLLIAACEEEENGEALRRLTWTRYGIRDGYLVWAPVHLVTAMEFVDEPPQVEAEALIDREIRNALLLPPADEAGAVS